jgi:MYXO-CTERM domain-containing protein
MLKKWARDLIAVWASILFAGPALAAVRYTFTSDQGDFTFISPSFFDGGKIPGPGGLVVSHSGNFDEVFFGSSDILLLNAACLSEDNCFDATFGESGIFQHTGTFFASDGDAKIVISGSPTAAAVPELSSWALLAVGLAGLAFARKRRVKGSRAYG